MNLLDFDKLNIGDKCDQVRFRGKFITYRWNYNHILNLYDMGSFFAEVTYSRREKQITNIQGMTLGDKRVNAYISSIILKS